MRLSLKDAATRLGKSIRQVRYMIQRGHLPAVRVGGRWVIESETLPLSDNQLQAANRKRERLREATLEALGTPEDHAHPRFSVRDLKAFQIAQPLMRRMLATLGSTHPAARTFGDAIEQLAIGAHRFDRSDKAEAYRTARDQASRTLCHLLAGPGELLRCVTQSEASEAHAATDPRGRRAGTGRTPTHGGVVSGASVLVMWSDKVTRSVAGLVTL